MPVKRRQSKQRQGISPEQWAFLTDAPCPEGGSRFEMMALEYGWSPLLKAKDIWEANRDAALEEYVADYPGHRPSLWWRYDAPETRGETESEAAFLARHDLFLPGERKRLKKRISNRKR